MKLEVWTEGSSFGPHASLDSILSANSFSDIQTWLNRSRESAPWASLSSTFITSIPWNAYHLLTRIELLRPDQPVFQNYLSRHCSSSSLVNPKVDCRIHRKTEASLGKIHPKAEIVKLEMIGSSNRGLKQSWLDSKEIEVKIKDKFDSPPSFWSSTCGWWWMVKMN